MGLDLSKTIDLARSLAQGRVSKVTLALLLNTYLQAGESTARSSALARLKHAQAGCTSSAEDYERRVSTSALTVNPVMTFHLWLTQYATVHGYLLASGANPHDWSSSRQKMEGILAMSEARKLIDVGAFTTKTGRAREITRLVLGDGRFNYDTPLATLSDVVWQTETEMRAGLQPTLTAGLPSAVLCRRGRPRRPQTQVSLPGWRQMTLDESGT
jgi:hypothetical protein